MAATPLVVLVLGLSLLCAITHLPQVQGSTTKGFSADLIHRDSPESPFHDPTSTTSSRLRAAFRRSATRAVYFRRVNSPNSISRLPTGAWSPITNDNFEVLMRFRMGSKGQKMFAIVDTGSDIIWLLCDPCPDCFEHKHDLFRTNSSESYIKLPCKGTTCSFLDEWSCDDDKNCKFNYEYIDNSFVNGLLSTDTIIFKSTTKHNVRIENIVFGCTHHTNGSFNENSIGISKINFGSVGVVSGPEAMTTPLFIDSYFYRINLETISIEGAENKPIIVLPRPLPHRGNMIMDTGDAFTYIDEKSMHNLKNVLMGLIPLPPINTAPPPLNLPINIGSPTRLVPKASMEEDEDDYDLCFDKRNAPKNIHLPSITFHFVGGASIVLDRRHAFQFINERSLCLSILSSGDDDGASVFGAYGQSGYLIGYDLDAKKLTFLPKQC